MSVEWPPARAAPAYAQQWSVGVHIQIRPTRETDKHRLGDRVADAAAKIPIDRARLLRQINQAEQRLVLHDRRGAPIWIADVRPVLESTGDRLQMKILRDQAGIIIRRRAGTGIARHRAGTM